MNQFQKISWKRETTSTLSELVLYTDLFLVKIYIGYCVDKTFARKLYQELGLDKEYDLGSMPCTQDADHK